MSDLKAQAEAIGIKVDGRWSDERLQQEIDKAMAAVAAATIPPNDAPPDGSAPAAPPPVPPPVAITPPAAPAPARKIAFRIMRDFWDGTGERHRKGKITEMTAEDALAGVESGALVRVA